MVADPIHVSTNMVYVEFHPLERPAVDLEMQVGGDTLRQRNGAIGRCRGRLEKMVRSHHPGHLGTNGTGDRPRIHGAEAVGKKDSPSRNVHSGIRRGHETAVVLDSWI